MNPTATTADASVPRAAADPTRAFALPRELIWAVPLALAGRLTFVALTGRVWEDALITLSHTQNLVLGIGLTAHPGEGHVYGFTSALSVLIPLPGELLTPGGGLIALRLASLVAVVWALVTTARIATWLGLSVWPQRLLLAYLALDPLQVFYGMAGMETQVAVAILLWSVWRSIQDRPILSGASLGLSLLVRPDFIIWVGWCLLAQARRSLRTGVVVAVTTLAVTGPWLLFTLGYYGTMLPQTIIAKSLVLTAPASGDPISWFVTQLSAHVETLARTYAPFLNDTMVVSAPVPAVLGWSVSLLTWAFIVVGIICTWQMDRWRPVILFFASYTLYRVVALPTTYFDWYVPPIAALGLVFAAAGLDQVVSSIPAKRASAIVLAAAFGLPLAFTIGIENRIQNTIEDPVRAAAGRYLASVVRTGDAVGTESAGYIGYYSHAEIYDFPGLTSPTALDAVRRLPLGQRDQVGMLASLTPPWIVVRPFERDALAARYPDIAAQYQTCRSFDAGIVSPVEWGGLSKRTIDVHLDLLYRGACP